MLLEIEGLDPFVKIVPEKTKCSSLSGGSISIVKNWSSSKMQLGYFIISFISNWPGLIIAEKPVVNTASTVIITDFMISKYTRDFTPSTPRQTPTAVKCDWVGWLWQCDKLPWSHITDGDNHYFVTFSPCHLAWSRYVGTKMRNKAELYQFSVICDAIPRSLLLMKHRNTFICYIFTYQGLNCLVFPTELITTIVNKTSLNWLC